MSALHIRPMTPADLPGAATASAAAFGIELGDEQAIAQWRERLAHPLTTDPDGAFIAERDGKIIGVAEAISRERLWCLSMLSVDPHVQGGGAGRVLLERALRYTDGTDAGLIVSSNDARALRLYAQAGFSLQPTLEAEGTVNRASLPRSAAGVREVSAGDLERLEPISRAVRGAAHTTDLRFALARGARLLRLADRGFAVLAPTRGVWLLVARDDEAATTLLWSALGLVEAGEESRVRWITARQQWAIGVVVKAGMRLSARGALCVRGNPGTLTPFVPSPPFA